MNIVKLKLAIREEEVLKLIRVNMPTPEKQKIENDRITAREDELFHMIVIKGTYDMPIMPEKSKGFTLKHKRIIMCLIKCYHIIYF